MKFPSPVPVQWIAELIKEKESNEKFSHLRVFWELIEISLKSRKKADFMQLNYGVHFLDSKDNPPEFG